jgi:hypothetical protein
MFSWGSRRRFLYIASAAFFVLFILVMIVTAVLYKRPSCNDGKQNGDEQGIDCGGSCRTVCRDAASPVQLDWARAFEVKDKYYSIAAYLQNPNDYYEASGAAYQFKVYDVNNILVAEKRGTTFIPAGQSFGVLEGGLYFGDRVPSRVTFEWQGNLVWVRTSSNKNLITIGDVVKTFDSDGLPKIDAVVINQGLRAAVNIFGFVVAYNNKGDAIAVSETVVDKVEGGGRGNMVFSWPAPFLEAINRVEVLHWIVPLSN